VTSLPSATPAWAGGRGCSAREGLDLGLGQGALRHGRVEPAASADIGHQKRARVGPRPARRGSSLELPLDHEGLDDHPERQRETAGTQAMTATCQP
jgi:hypothetical protein